MDTGEWIRKKKTITLSYTLAATVLNKRFLQQYQSVEWFLLLFMTGGRGADSPLHYSNDVPR